MSRIQLSRRQVLAGIGATACLPLLSSRLLAADSDLWAAMAYSEQRRHLHWVTGYSDRESAEGAAMRANGAPDAKVVMSGRGCWLAFTAAKGGWGAASRRTLSDAVDAAKDNCKEVTGEYGQVRGCVYGGRGGVDFCIEYDDDFSFEEKRILSGAIQYMRYLMCLVEVKGPLNAIATDHYYYHELLNQTFKGEYAPNPDRMRSLMYMQLASLERYKHPDMKLVAYYEKSNYWAKAPIGRIIVPYGVTDDITGSSEIKINRYWLGSDGDGSNRLVWAGVLTHELMHNLGHMHGQDEYGDHLQINAIQQLVRTRGEYKKNSRCPAFACDCRQLWR